jgi:hypothetical protein
MNAAKTRAKVAQTSFRNSDFSGAIRKYDTRMEIFTVLEARTKSVWPAKEAWLSLGSAYSSTGYTEAYLSSLFQRRRQEVPDMAVPTVKLRCHDDEDCGANAEDLIGVRVATWSVIPRGLINVPLPAASSNHRTRLS